MYRPSIIQVGNLYVTSPGGVLGQYTGVNKAYVLTDNSAAIMPENIANDLVKEIGVGIVLPAVQQPPAPKPVGSGGTPSRKK